MDILKPFSAILASRMNGVSLGKIGRAKLFDSCWRKFQCRESRLPPRVIFNLDDSIMNILSILVDSAAE